MWLTGWCYSWGGASKVGNAPQPLYTLPAFHMHQREPQPGPQSRVKLFGFSVQNWHRFGLLMSIPGRSVGIKCDINICYVPDPYCQCFLITAPVKPEPVYVWGHFDSSVPWETGTCNLMSPEQSRVQGLTVPHIFV